ncbi:MAG: NUDIX domain-containing protein [Candidatus Daviesbacteria bacterium]|nr:NUDIX domain-containing protein [Candidatus Daviesbacteria bacterium]
MKRQAVIIIIIRGTKTLLERRLPESTLANHFLFPGGSIEKNEILDPVKALKREAMEELGIIPIKFMAMPDFTGELGTLLKPYVVSSWTGKIPNKILDRGNPVFWEEIDMVLQSPLESVVQMIKEAQKILSLKI